MIGDTLRAVPAETVDRPEVERLLLQYLRELPGVRAGPADSHAYPYFDLYWTEPDRRAFLIKAGDQLAGFALVNAWSPSGLPVDRAMAEFFVVPTRRGQGIGARAAVKIISGLPGRWEIGILTAHDSARTFWTHVVKQIPGAVPEWRKGDGKRWSGQIVRFRSTGQA